MNTNDLAHLTSVALEARAKAYAPYSHFLVGAALQTADGQIFSGCNVENLSFGLTICAERVALASAVAAGKREFARIVIATDSNVPASPCGACRQVLAEFAPDLAVVCVNLRGETFEASLAELLPRAREGILG